MSDEDEPIEGETPEQQSEPPARQHGDRFKKGDDVFQQLEEIEELQRKIRQRKAPGVIDSIEKSQQRVKNRCRDVRRASDIEELE